MAVAARLSGARGARCAAPRRAGRTARAVRVTAAAEEEDFEAKLAAISKRGAPGANKLKRQERRGDEDAPKPKAAAAAPPAEAGDAAEKDWGAEEVFFEGRPATGELVTNIAFGISLIWLPLTLASIGRYAWVQYKVTDKRVSVRKTSPFQQDNIDVPYSQITEVVCIGRGAGFWGDMVLTLKDGSKTELRSIPQHREIEQYIQGRIDLERGKLKGEELVAGDDGVLRSAATSKGFGA